MVCLTHCFKRNIRCMLILGLILPLAAAGASEQEQVLASIKPLALIAQEITDGTTLKVGYLLSPSVSEHSYALKISDIKRLRNASLVLWLDKDAEPYLTSTENSWRPSSNPKKSLSLLAATPSMPRGVVDPHVWLSPVLAEGLAEQIAERLSEIYPANKALFETNLKQFRQKVVTLDNLNAKALEPYSHVPFFVHHDAYGYFVNHYGLKQVGVLQIQPETPLSLKQTRVLQLAMQEQNQDVCLFQEPQLSPIRAAVFRSSLIIEGYLDPLGIDASNYSELIENLRNGFLACFIQVKKNR